MDELTRATAVSSGDCPDARTSARFEGRSEATGDATLVVVPGDTISGADPWIARLTAYPGIGSAIAWEKRVSIPANETISRGFRIGLFDGRLDRERMAAVADSLRADIEG